MDSLEPQDYRRKEVLSLMGRILATLVAALLLLALGVTAGCAIMEGGNPDSATAGAGGNVEWTSDWSEALRAAQAENKPIMINFYTNICPACRLLDRNAFSDDELSSFLSSSFICLRSNAATSGLHSYYGIPGVPTTVFTSPDGAEIGRILGAAPTDRFYQGARAVLDQWQH